MAKTAEQVKQEAFKIVYDKLVSWVKADHDDIERIWDRGDLEDVVYDALGVVAPDDTWIPAYDKVQKALEYYKPYEVAFKAEYGMSSIKFTEKLDEEDLENLKPHEAKFIKDFGRYMSCSFTVMDLQTGRITMYMASPKKMVIKPEWDNGLYVTDETAKEFGMPGLQETIMFLERMGVKMGKRPKHKRINSFSLYD